jgi:hypothetical protein
MTSVPGAREMRFEALPGSALQASARRWAISSRGPARAGASFEMSSSGALVPPTEGSTNPVSVVVTKAGLATVFQYDLRMP